MFNKAFQIHQRAAFMSLFSVVLAFLLCSVASAQTQLAPNPNNGTIDINDSTGDAKNSADPSFINNGDINIGDYGTYNSTTGQS